MRRRIKGRLRSKLYFFFNWELLQVRALWPHVGGNSGRTVGGRGGGGGRGVCPVPVTGQGPPGRGQGACHRVFWAQKLVKLGDFREQSQNLA